MSVCTDDSRVRVDSPAPVGPAWDALSAADGVLAELRRVFDERALLPSEAMGLAEHLHRLEAQVRSLHGLAVTLVADSGAWGEAGYLSAGAWIRATHLVDGQKAHAQLRTARWVAENPAIGEAFAAGQISASHVDVIRTVVMAKPGRAEHFADVAAHVLEVARNATPRHTARVMRAWAELVDPDGADEDAASARERRRLFVSKVAEGWDISGWLPDTEGAELAGILNELMERQRRESTQSQPSTAASARRADALLDLVRAAAASDLSKAERDRARVFVTVPLEVLVTDPDAGRSHGGTQGSLDGAASSKDSADVAGDTGLHEVFEVPERATSSWRIGNGPGGGFLSRRDLRRLSCDGQIQRIVLGPCSQPLDIGRATRVVPPGLRSAVELRDGGCVADNCDRPPGWCEAHHIQHWADGGLTSIDNLALLCSAHHHQLHQGWWWIEMGDDARPQVRRW